MALRPDRDYAEVTDISNYWSTSLVLTAAAGGIASVVTQGSGTALDDTQNVVTYVVTPSGAIPKGVLLHPVNPVMSATRDFKNFANGEIRPGEKCVLLRKGWCVTDKYAGSPVAGDIAYVGSSGLIADTQANAGCLAVGRFEGSPDADGFVKVYIDI